MACCKACWCCKPTEVRTFAPSEVRLLVAAGRQLAPIVSEARTVEQFIAPAQQKLKALAQNLWWSWDDDAVALFRDLDPVKWRELDHNPIALFTADLGRQAGRAGLAARAAQPDQLCLSPVARVSELRKDVGLALCRHPVGPAGRVFLGRVWHS